MGPDYVRPESPVPQGWSSPLEGGLQPLEPDQAALAQFWTGLGDETLNQLVERALTGNFDVQGAEARLRETRALRKEAIGAFFPRITASGEGNHQRIGPSARSRNTFIPRETGITVDLYSASVDASWEIDLFGRLRRGLEAANAERDAAIEDLRDVQVSLVGELALSYVDVRALQERLRIAEATHDSQSETYDITRWRAEAGLTTELDVEQARSALAATEAAIPTLRSAIAADMNGIAILLGAPPGDVDQLLFEPRPIPVSTLEVAVGVPGQTLAQRPDVRRAERQLAAETARIGVVTADAYPSLNALGSIGVEALSPGGLLRAGAKTWALGATATQTLFAGGQVIAAIEAEKAVRDQVLANYQTAVLGALNEVENALVAYVQEQDRRKALFEGAQAAERALTLAQDQYGSGLIDFQTVLDSQRSLYLLQDQLAQSEGQVTSNLVRLYKALGGGWTPGVSS